MANKIQIKRSTANATVTGLANGELAFTQASNTLHIGLPDGSGVLRIGGAQYPGTLTNNHALVANASGGIDKVIAANVVPTKIYANGGFGTANYVLVSGGDSSNVYWESASAVGGVNTAAQYTFSNTITFNGSTVTNAVSVTSTTSSSNTTTGALTVAGGLGVAGRINTGDLAAGNDSVYSSLTGTTLTTANVFATDTVNASVLSVGGWVIANNGGVYTSGAVNAAIIRVGSQFAANTTQVSLSQGMKLSANGALGSANQVLRSDSSGTVYWSDDNGDISAVTAGNGLSGGGSSGDVTLSVNGGSTLTVNTSGVHVNSTLSITDLTLSGNLTINGTLTTVDTTNLVVNDSIIELARNNSADSLDIGWYGKYNDGSDRYTGLIWDTSADVYELFANTTAAPTTTLNTSGTGYSLATLHAFLNTGAFVANATSVALTANSSVDVNIVANTLSLSSPLPGTSGGTGLSSVTAQDILVGNSSNGFNKLSLGTAGYVLQSNGSALVYDSLDGGTF